MLNRVVLIGRLTRDIELRHVGSDGVAVARFTLAVNRQFKRDEADFISVVAWRKTAEICSEYLGKGSQVAIEGRIQTGSYEKDGITVYTTDVVADNVQFLDSKRRLNDDPFSDDGKPIEINDDDLPF